MRHPGQSRMNGPVAVMSGRLRSSLAALAALTVFVGCTSGAPALESDQARSATAAPSVARVVAMNRAVGFGLLRVMTLGERPGALDVVIYDGLPNEMPRVAGVITTVMQTPLSHVNLRAVQDQIPNAVVANALDDSAVTKLVGRYVRYEVTSTGYSLRPSTQAEVEAHHENERPATPQVPQRDLAVTEIRPLSNIGFEDWTAFGVKAANVATLRTFQMDDVVVPDGFGVPFYFYDEFMRRNGLYRVARSMLANKQFDSDPDLQAAQLESFRTLIKNAPMPAEFSRALQTVRKQFPADSGVRCRSSTNNEDLPGFSGAGLYDSKTQHADEGPLDKCVKQVFASVWNLRAYLEREYYRIDHLATAMGVLLIPATENERANGVAVSIDPVYDEPDAFYVNAQLGENLVTNPNALQVPEELLLYGEGTMDVVSRSSLVQPGEMLLNDEIIASLRAALRTIHDRFAALYGVKGDEQFAMEIEFKVIDSGELMIKQARTWQFADESPVPKVATPQ
jgi:hypothetical protein